MSQCVLLHAGGFSNTENLGFPKGVCVGCAQKTERNETRRLGYGSHYFDKIVIPVCEKCSATENERLSFAGEGSTTTPLGVWVDLALPIIAIGTGIMYHLPWPVVIAAALASLFGAALLLEPVFYRIRIARRLSQWKMRYPEWPLSLPVVNLWRGDVLPSGEVSRLLGINEPATGEEWTVLACPSTEYAKTHAAETQRKTAPLLAPPPVHQDDILLPGIHDILINFIPFRTILLCLFLYFILVGIWWQPLGHLPLWWKIILSAVAVPCAWVLSRILIRLVPHLDYNRGF